MLARHMEQRGVCEDPVKVFGRQLKREEILLPDFATAMLGGENLF
jgi:hypothetical protein